MALPSQHLAAAEAPPCAIFCKGLAKGASERQIAALFQGFGTVVDCQIARHRSGRSAGFAIVTFSTHEEASAAVRGMDSATFMGRPLSCRWYQQERDCAEGLLVQPPRQGSPALQAQQQLAQGQLPLPTQLQGNHHQSHMLASAAAAMTGPSGTGIPSPRRQEQQQQALRLQQQARGGMAFGAIDSAAAGRSKALLAPLSLEQWTSLPLSQAPAFSSHAAAAAPGMSSEEGPDGVRRWSTMVNLWLQDYLNQDGPMDTHSSLSDPGLDVSALRRSLDGLPPPSVERRRSTRDSLSRCLDSLNLAGGLASDHLLPHSLSGSAGGAPPPSDSAFLTKSRLATKWIADCSGGAAPGAAHTAPGSAGGAAMLAAAAAAPAGTSRSSDDFHVLADIKLLTSALSCPDAPAFLSSSGWAPSNAAAAGPLKFDALPSSAPHTAASSPPGKLSHQPRSFNWQDDASCRQHFVPSGCTSGPQALRGGPGNGHLPQGLSTQGLGQGGMPHQGLSHQAQAQALQLQALQAQVAQQQHMVAMQAAQEHYVSALNQLTFANSQVLAAAAALKDAGSTTYGPLSGPMPAAPLASFGGKVQAAAPSCQPSGFGSFAHPGSSFATLRGALAAPSIF